MPITIFLAVVVLITLSLNVKATMTVRRESLSEPLQLGFQFLLIWLVPLLGAILVLAIFRQPDEPSRQYRKENEEIDGIEDFNTGIASAGDSD